MQHLTYKLKGNNVPMPSAVVKQLLRFFIGDIIWRRLQVGHGAATGHGGGGGGKPGGAQN